MGGYTGRGLLYVAEGGYHWKGMGGGYCRNGNGVTVGRGRGLPQKWGVTVGRGL